MNWKEFTQSCQSDTTASDADCAISSLSSLGLIKVQGEDARDFLQGQLTNDIMAVSPEQGQLSAWCTPKGRMLALMLIFQRDDDLYLQLPGEQLDPVLKRLRMFVMRSKVILEDVSDTLPVLALGGNCLADLPDSIPANDFACTQTSGISLIRFPGETPRVQAVGEPEALTALLDKIRPDAITVKESWWTLQNIRNGIPELGNRTAETFVPQMLNLDLLNGISFTKGCYTGQEVVARMKYLGQLKRRMYLARFESASNVEAGDALFSEQSKSAQGAGKVVTAIKPGNDQWKALVVAEITSVENGEIHLGDKEGAVLNLSEPPYGLEVKE
jgi:folate-binding protein YgfZ